MVGVKQVKIWCICALYFQYVVELWMCFEYVLNVFSMCLVGFKIESHIFRQKKYCRKKGELIGILVFLYWFSLKQMQEGIWVEKKNQQIRQKNIEHIPCNEAAEKLKPRQKNRNRASAKSNGDFCLFLDPKQRFLYKIQLFLGWFLRVYLNQVFSAYKYIVYIYNYIYIY